MAVRSPSTLKGVPPWRSGRSPHNGLRSPRLTFSKNLHGGTPFSPNLNGKAPQWQLYVGRWGARLTFGPNLHPLAQISTEGQHNDSFFFGGGGPGGGPRLTFGPNLHAETYSGPNLNGIRDASHPSENDDQTGPVRQEQRKNNILSGPFCPRSSGGAGQPKGLVMPVPSTHPTLPTKRLA